MDAAGFDSPRPAQLRRFGRVFYGAGLRMQHALAEFVRDGARPDQLVMLEHDAVFTLGRNATRADILVASDFLDAQGVSVHETDRGGEVTYHGPGQIVAYPLVDLRRIHLGVREMVERIEQSVIDVLADWNILGQRRDGAPGVYVAGAKIAALGLRIRRGCSFHGLAFNVAMDLEPFHRINPCGYQGLQVTSVRDLGGPSRAAELVPALVESLSRQLGLCPRWPDGAPALAQTATGTAHP